jgi:hypothetical protein
MGEAVRVSELVDRLGRGPLSKELVGSVKPRERENGDAAVRISFTEDEVQVGHVEVGVAIPSSRSHRVCFMRARESRIAGENECDERAHQNPRSFRMGTSRRISAVRCAGWIPRGVFLRPAGVRITSSGVAITSREKSCSVIGRSWSSTWSG